MEPSIGAKEAARMLIHCSTIPEADRGRIITLLESLDAEVETLKRELAEAQRGTNGTP